MQREMKINRWRTETFFLISDGQNTVVHSHFAAHSPALQFLRLAMLRQAEKC